MHGAAVSRSSEIAPRPAHPPAAAAAARPALALACLWDDAAVDEALVAARRVLHQLGVSLEPRAVPASLARGGTVGRIGVPPQALDVVAGTGVALGATVGRSPLAPLPRLWRGLQRRCDVLLDIRHCVTLPGSDADLLGHERDVVLISQRRVERTAPGQRLVDGDVGGWSRARRIAELAFRMAAADRREVVFAVAPGRVTAQQALLADACQREAQRLGLDGVRIAKAGLLAALLTGDAGARPLVVVSPMPMDELSAAVAAAIGDTGPWPVIAAGERTTFYDMPPVRGAAGSVDPTGVLLACVAMLQRQGLREPAYALLHAVRLARAAEARMRPAPGERLVLGADVFARAVIAHLGRHRVPPQAPADAGEPGEPAIEGPVHGLRIRVASRDAAALRGAVGEVVEPAGLEVASVRPVDEDGDRHDVRVRVRLGEAAIDDAAADRLITALVARIGACVVVPWRDALGAPARPAARPAPVAASETPALLRRTGRLTRRAAAS